MPNRTLPPLDDRGPLRTLFVITSMPVGGAETLLVNLCRRFNRERILPEICCLKEPGPLGEQLSAEMPVHSGLLHSKWDLRVLGRLRTLLRERRIDAVVTVGAGDKMFWGRMAAWRESVPVVCSALHSTGWPDVVGRLNRTLTPITDAFIACAGNHGRFLIEQEGFPHDKVHVIPNGVDTERFRPRGDARRELRQALAIPADAPVVAIVAALRPEKNHELFLEIAARVKKLLPATHFVLVGNGPLRPALEATADRHGLSDAVRFLGNRTDIAEVLSASDLFALTSRNEANPVSILEALACGLPVVAPKVGSIPETVRPGTTGELFPVGDAEVATRAWLDLLTHSGVRLRYGKAGRDLVAKHFSLERMVTGYEDLLRDLYRSKSSSPAPDEAACELPIRTASV